MQYQDPHLSDQELLLAADGELPLRRQRHVQVHLKACWTCRSRMGEVQQNIGKLVHEYHSLFDPPPDPHSQDQLRDQLQRLGQPRQFAPFWRLATAAVSLFILIAGAMLFLREQNRELTVPNPSLTPGEVSVASKQQVCQAGDPGETGPIPEALKQQVFAVYGMPDAAREAYEVDFLITPGLGGSVSLRNLWPQPYSSRHWSAHVKDVLEDRLHSLVCDGSLDLSTAQRDIATNWVDAYKKYVHTNQPM